MRLSDTTTRVVPREAQCPRTTRVVPRGEPLSMSDLLCCRECDTQVPRAEFSSRQLRNHPHDPRCRNCARGQRPPPKSKHNYPAEGDAIVDACVAAGLTSASAPSGRLSGKFHPTNFGFTVYLDKLFALDCFPELVARRVFPSAKDVTESYAAINAIQRHSTLDAAVLASRRVMCIAVGDGCSPRTAALASYLTGWDCVSVDPNMHGRWLGGVGTEGIERLQCHALTWDAYAHSLVRSAPTAVDALVLLCVHSHHRFGAGEASVAEVRRALGNPPTAMASIPCCHTYSHVHDVGPADLSYEDWGIFSAKRVVNVWTWAAEPQPATEDDKLGCPAVCQPCDRLNERVCKVLAL